MRAVCSSVISDGGDDLQEMPGRPFVATGQLAGTAAGTLIVIKSKQFLNSLAQSVITIPLDLDVSVSGAACWIEIRRNATVSAGTYTNIDAASVMEVSYAGNPGTDPVVTAGTGTLVDRFYVPASATLRSSKTGGLLGGLLGKTLLVYSHLLGAGDTLSVIWNGGTVATDVFGSLRWKEIR
jgi:hypothetical protein